MRKQLLNGLMSKSSEETKPAGDASTVETDDSCAWGAMDCMACWGFPPPRRYDRRKKTASKTMRTVTTVLTIFGLGLRVISVLPLRSCEDMIYLILSLKRRSHDFR